MRTRYVCTWTLAIWGDRAADVEEVARKIQNQIQDQLTSIDYDILQSNVLGPMLVPQEEIDCQED